MAVDTGRLVPDCVEDPWAGVSAALERRPASAAVRWAVDTFGDDLVVAVSFQDLVLVDICAKVKPDIEFLFLDTAYHFPETLHYMEVARQEYGLNLTVASADLPADESPCGSRDCCARRKVEPLRRHLAGRKAWITGVRRVDNLHRSDAPIVAHDRAHDLVKVNPLAPWTDLDIAGYEADHDLERHPLFALGYRSIGCSPQTRPTAEGEDPRAGRWAGSAKTECGLHP